MEKLLDKFKKAHCFINTGKIEEAEKFFSKIYNKIELLNCKNNPKLLELLISSLLGLGEVNMKKGLWKESLKYYIKADSYQPNKFNILFNIGVVHHNLGDKEKALDILLKAKKIEPKNNQLLNFINEVEGKEQNKEIIENIDFNQSFEEKIQKMINSINN